MSNLENSRHLSVMYIYRSGCKSLAAFKGRVGNFGETGSRSLEIENTQPEKICHFLIEPLLQHTRTRT